VSARLLPKNNGAKLAIALDSVRLLSPDVVLETGSTTVTAKDVKPMARFIRRLRQEDGKWKISQLVETPQPDVTRMNGCRSSDGWSAIGRMQTKGDNLTVRSKYVWARGGNFLTRNVTVKRGAETTLEGWQIIGWDPIEGCIRSWTFDDEGGFSEGRWTRRGQSLAPSENWCHSGGSRTAADNTFPKISDDRFIWESNNRSLDGLPQPGLED